MHQACALNEENSLKRENEDFLTRSLMFLNALLTATKDDFSTAATLRKEFTIAKVPLVVDWLVQREKTSIHNNLQVQIKSFQEVMMEGTLPASSDDSNQLSSSIASKLRGLPIMSNFVHILHILKAKAEETDFGDKAYEDWRMLDSMVAKACTHDDYESTVREIRLQDKLNISQKQISKLENRERSTSKH
ncbi:glyceraldehyde-3-phosphate dehydrogenase A [Acrasis kona]|uniref:Glyceraldehyde-3-phosphate dehydrogenase A n=1 Tax=Acrasis kona TaxID=1008807 RepID=A0AAW2YWB9_9EUKA